MAINLEEAELIRIRHDMVKIALTMATKEIGNAEYRTSVNVLNNIEALADFVFNGKVPRILECV